MNQFPAPISSAGIPGVLGSTSIVPSYELALATEQALVARTNFFDHLIEGSLHSSSNALMPLSACGSRPAPNPVPSNYVVRRDHAGRPIVWRIGGMTRKITYLANGKIKTFEDTGKLSPLAASDGSTIYLLGFETHDGGSTYIGRLMVSQEVDSLVMTDLYLKNDGTVVVTDDSGLEMTWNPNNGDASTEFAEHNRKRETWIDHLDGTVTIKSILENGASLEMNGLYGLEFCATKTTVKSNGGTIELQASGSAKVCRTIVDSRGRSDVKIVTMDMLKITRALMQAETMHIVWLKGKANGVLVISDGKEGIPLSIGSEE